jgi:hypothetical protein
MNHPASVLKAVVRALVLAALIVAPRTASAAPVPPPDKLLPEDTLFLLTIPDFAKGYEIYQKWPQSQFWADPAMKPFRDKFVTKLKEDFIQPLERELSLKFEQLSGLAQGQITLAITQNGWDGKSDKEPAFLLLIDTKDRSSQLKTNIAELRKRWADANKPLRVEKVRDFEFLVLTLTTNDVPKTFKKFFPPALETHELGEQEGKKPDEKSEVFIGHAESLFIMSDSLKPVERIVARATGASTPVLGEQDSFSRDYQAFFRDAPLYGWLNAKSLVEVLARVSAEKKENPAAPNPFEVVKPEKLVGATGLLGLRSVAFSVQPVEQGALTQFFLGVPESGRQGIFKILAAEAKESTPPPFVPAEAVKYQRWRIDGQKAWGTLEKMAAEISPQLVSGLNFLLDTANLAGKEKDPGFDLRKNLIGNLGDDMISYEKNPRGPSPAEIEDPPSVFLLGSANAEQLAASLKNLFVFFNQGASSPSERDFLGRKIFTVTMPSMPLPMGGGNQGPPRSLHYAASGGYVAMSSDAPALEEYLRSGDSNAKKLREVQGLNDASQRVLGPGSGLFGYENQAETMRVVFEALKRDPSSSTNMGTLAMLSGMPGRTTPERNFGEWLDFSLLPGFERVSKYFYFIVYGGATTSDGLTYRMYSPVPPQLKAGAASK